eukprot:7404947-Karenia_brevis.AAC.1
MGQHTSKFCSFYKEIRSCLDRPGTPCVSIPSSHSDTYSDSLPFGMPDSDDEKGCEAFLSELGLSRPDCSSDELEDPRHN